MNILAEIHRREGVKVAGRTVHRTAIRGIALRGSELLMVHSSAVGDYKFPGGGLQEGETHQQALAREIEEECGMLLSRFGQEIGAVVEYNFAVEPEYDVFKMTSHYYRCEVKAGSSVQKLEDYEARLGFRPVWIDAADAIRFNKAMISSPRSPACLRREIFMLEYILQDLPPGHVPKDVLDT
jgi:8-oxo-dGTP pyrophosphatase MutT (NUDIX family)